jgi:hypothetical protein
MNTVRIRSQHDADPPGAIPLPPQPLIPEELVTALRRDIEARRVKDGMERLSQCTNIFDLFHPSLENAAAFLAVVARWCDVGYGDPKLIRRMLATYGSQAKSSLSISDYVYLRFADGMAAMTEEMSDSAIESFDIVLKLGGEINAQDILPIAEYWSARCFRKKGNYESALLHVRRGRDLQLARGEAQCAAAMQVLEGLILFDQGDRQGAVASLGAAEAVLAPTDDHVSLGNIESTYGRILQSEGRYRQSIDHYSRAVEQFKKLSSKDGNVARTIMDMSFTRIHIARQLRRNIDLYASHQHKNGKQLPRNVLVKELSKLTEAILDDLNRVAAIYEKRSNASGLAKSHLYRGHLYFSVGELDMAAAEAAQAYAGAESKRQFIIMASARNLQCVVENTRVEEEIEGCADYALDARDYALEAVELANRTQDRRLLAIVHTWYGLTLSNSFFNSHERAREEMELAATYLEPGVHDYIWDDFQVLKTRLLENNTLDAKLTQWARGEVGTKTFRELEEDLANLVIPMVWHQEGRKVSRVAARFSISPRKVRRVLARLGYLVAEFTPEDDDVAIPAQVEDDEAEDREAPERMQPIGLSPLGRRSSSRPVGSDTRGSGRPQ